ncbi:hypothetical protein KKA15_04445 [Patescibacteria group bacterium]|nr:hypothetical protein [Patescibacteria group bacterium]
MAKILVTAENFAFGPIGKILPIARELKEHGHELSFAGYGTSLQLANKFSFSKIYAIDTDEKNNTEKLCNIICENDLLISSMDISSVKLAKQKNVPVVWVDCLFWFWNNIPSEILNVDLFIVENSLNNSINKKKYFHKIKNVKLVGPIVGKTKKSERDKKALVSFGGAEALYWYQVKRKTGYPYVMTEIFTKMIDWGEFDFITIATNQKIVNYLKKEYQDPRFNFECIPYQDFLSELATTEILITTPGLVAAEAAFYYQTPTIFLPASNNSQYIQLDKYRDLGLGIASIHLSDYMPRLELNGIPPHDSIRQVMEQLSTFEKSKKLREKVGFKINELIQNRAEWSEKSVRNGEEFIKSKGGNGIDKAVELIEKLIVK